VFVVGRPDGFRARGRSAGAELAAFCDGPCRVGGTLRFRINGATSGGYFEAWAERSDGERIWYFSGDNAVPVPAQPGEQLVARAVVLGPEATPGHYRIHLVLSKTALDKAQLLDTHDDTVVPVEVVP
jgi:hypothetical protein